MHFEVSPLSELFTACEAFVGLFVRVRPSVQLHIPLQAECLLTYVAFKGTFTRVGHHVPFKFGHIVADYIAIRALEHFLLSVLLHVVLEQRLADKRCLALLANVLFWRLVQAQLF